MSTVIKVENLSKRYRIGVINRDMLYKDLQSRWAKFRGKEDPNAPIGFKHDKRLEHGDEFWALRNVDLEVKEGEILGIIGRNGAGKSTLLKILSQITAPTEGRIKVKGRIASLLEVGTGFHPELTGRENVYLNGAILGMTRKEVRSKFDEIVAFAEIDEFIDTPVKRYSSGMYVRLAFAVAAHLDPEILIVDEVLAVGDASFQQKCLGKMKDVSRGQGRTVLFVSHNMASVQALCGQAVLLDEGANKLQGKPNEVVAEYLRSKTKESITLDARRDRTGTGEVVATKITYENGRGENIHSACAGQPLTIKISYKVTNRQFEGPVIVGVGVTTLSDIPVFLHHSRLSDASLTIVWPEGYFALNIPKLPLPEGGYCLNISVAKNNQTIDHVTDASRLNVESGQFFARGELPPASHGLVLVEGVWTSGDIKTDETKR